MNYVERITQIGRMVSQTDTLIEQEKERRQKIMSNIRIRLNFMSAGINSPHGTRHLQDIRKDYIASCERISNLSEQKNRLLHEMTALKK